MKTFATSVFKVEHFVDDFLWIVATTTKICTRDYLMKVHTLHFIILWIVIANKMNLHVILQKNVYMNENFFTSFVQYKFLPLAPSIFETFSFGEWVVTHSLANINFHDHRLAV